MKKAWALAVISTAIMLTGCHITVSTQTSDAELSSEVTASKNSTNSSSAVEGITSETTPADEVNQVSIDKLWEFKPHSSLTYNGIGEFVLYDPNGNEVTLHFESGIIDYDKFKSVAQLGIKFIPTYEETDRALNVTKIDLYDESGNKLDGDTSNVIDNILAEARKTADEISKTAISVTEGNAVSISQYGVEATFMSNSSGYADFINDTGKFLEASIKTYDPLNDMWTNTTEFVLSKKFPDNEYRFSTSKAPFSSDEAVIYVEFTEVDSSKIIESIEDTDSIINISEVKDDFDDFAAEYIYNDTDKEITVKYVYFDKEETAIIKPGEIMGYSWVYYDIIKVEN